MENIDVINKLIALYKKFPTIGSKSATRLAYATLSLSTKDRDEFIEAFNICNNDIKKCPNCGIYYETKCPICDDNTREKDKILIISNQKDIYSIESTNSYKGTYYTLNGLISPFKNISEENIGVEKLQERIKENNVKEIIIALPTNLEGETTALYLAHLFKDSDIKVTKIASGIPFGTNLEYLDQTTLSHSLSNRIEMKKD